MIAATGALFLWAPMHTATAKEPVQVGSLVFDIDYEVAEEALPLNSVTLWYRAGDDPAWQVFGLDDDCQSPVTFRAPHEGRYAFYIVTTNATGASSVPPVAETPAHVEAFVDATPPVVQLHALRSTLTLGQPVVQIRWTAVDAHFGPRPVVLAYQRPPDPTWHPMTPDPVANTGRYDWRVPDGLTGPLAARLTVTDLGGHQVRSDSQTIEVAQIPPIQPSGTLAADGPAPTTTPGFENTALAGSARARAQARRLFAQATAHQARGEYREGIARLRQAIQLDPSWPEAFTAMADMLYGIGDLDRALHAYDLALQQDPTMRDALRGAAAVHRKRNNHALAAEALRTILRYNPNDAEVWMNLGDVAVYQGDEVLARECYTRASRIDPEATQVAADARKRLELMTEVSRQYRASGR
jgi:Flp pilus assembly protein TadD